MQTDSIMKKVYILTALLALLSGAASAQKGKLKAVVNIENEYNPNVTPVNKKSFTPSIDSSQEATQHEIIFSEKPTPFESFVSNRDTKTIAPKQDWCYNGYARLGYSTANGIDAAAAYRFKLTDRDNIKAFAALNGFKGDLDGKYYDWNSRMYNSLVDLGYTHMFSKLKLDVAGDFSNMVFNYQSATNSNTATDKQNSSNFGFGVKGTSVLSGSFSYKFHAGYTLSSRKYSTDSKTGIAENRLNAGGEAAFQLGIEELSNLGLAVNVDMFMYNKALKSPLNGYTDYVSADIDPYLNFNFNGWGLRVGTKMNFITANGPAFAIAPDVKVEKDFSERVHFYALLTGGRTNNTMRLVESISPYWGFDKNAARQLEPTYRIVDANIGTSVTFEPVFLEFAAGYAYTKNDLLQCEEISANSNMYINLAQANTNNAYIFARAGYDLGGWLDISANARYDYWGCDNKNLLMMKPEISCSLNAEARVLKTLTFRLDYNFAQFTKGEENKRHKAKNELNLRASYQILPWLGAFAEGKNLLGSKYCEYEGYVTRGARAMLGVTANF